LLCHFKYNIEVLMFNNLFCVVTCRTLDKTISSLEMELAAARSVQESLQNGAPLSDDMGKKQPQEQRRFLMVVGINTAFSSRKRRDSIRATWMPQGFYYTFIFDQLCSLMVVSD